MLAPVAQKISQSKSPCVGSRLVGICGTFAKYLGLTGTRYRTSFPVFVYCWRASPYPQLDSTLISGVPESIGLFPKGSGVELWVPSGSKK